MRYIGSKAHLLKDIENFIARNIKTRQRVFCDIFSGTASVACYFKPEYKIISNDSLYFSYVIQKALIENNLIPEFTGLKKQDIEPFSYFEDYIYAANPKKPRKSGFIEQNYSPSGKDGRMYFTPENARSIDFVRSSIEKWKTAKLVTENEYFYLLSMLLQAVPSVSNITGTYGAYLKKWDRRAFKKLEIPRFEITDNGMENEAYNQDSLKLINNISGDILYIDPPYNERQYSSNYHLLETIARYDSPAIHGITGMRACSGQKSQFCSKSTAEEALAELLKKADFSHIVISYSSSGIISSERIEKILKGCGQPSSYSFEQIPYRKYKSKIYDKSPVCEYLFYVRKKKTLYHVSGEERKKELSLAADNSANYGKQALLWPDMEHKTKPAGKKISANYGAVKKYIKSPLNYIGGKYRLLPQIMPLIPKKIGTFVDLFCGGCNVGINADCEKVIFNDLNNILVNMLKTLAEMPLVQLIANIENRIREWNLSMENEAAFISFRSHYNKTRDPLDLYILSCFSFNYQFRFNSRHEYNNPFGRNRSRFSETMKNNLMRFVQKAAGANVKFSSFSFDVFPFEELRSGDFVYCDPPYLITTGSYNDGNRGFKDWSAESDAALMEVLDGLNKRRIRFALSNVLSHKGLLNHNLIKWSEKYNVNHLSKDYSNSCYNTSRAGSDEVLITNYKL
ncbi:MAG: Dam family site-specific DNA-(adenine-N6)-methyltransferase [Elusimicrobiales bacterium]|nr:Dam family site-specific DNA-(adenine-N6)-methyltransferase [Elusimicrobiales bacterium]